MDKLLTIVVSTYDQATSTLPVLLQSLTRQQTDSYRFVVNLVHDGPNDGSGLGSWDRTRDEFWRATVGWGDFCGSMSKCLRTEDRTNNWGHSQRVLGLQYVTTPYVHFTNGDNYYVPVFVEYMLRRLTAGDAPDLVYCDALMNYSNINGCGELPYNVMDVTPQQNRIDWCCFVARTEHVRQVGINTSNRDADGELVTGLMKLDNFQAVKVPFVGAVHN